MSRRRTRNRRGWLILALLLACLMDRAVLKSYLLAWRAVDLTCDVATDLQDSASAGTPRDFDAEDPDDTDPDDFAIAALPAGFRPSPLVPVWIHPHRSDEDAIVGSSERVPGVSRLRIPPPRLISAGRPHRIRPASSPLHSQAPPVA